MKEERRLGDWMEEALTSGGAVGGKVTVGGGDHREKGARCQLWGGTDNKVEKKRYTG